MAQTLRCPECEAYLALPVLAADQTVQCPRCERVFAPAAAVPKRPERTPEQRVAPTLFDEPMTLPRPKALWGRGLATAAMLLLGLCVFSYAFQTCLHYELMHIEKQDRAFGGVEQRFLRGLQPHAGMQAAVELDEHRREVERWLSNSYPFHQIIFFVTTIVFLSWLYCASTNAWNMHALGMYFVPNTAVLSFFIPMLNLFWPYLVLQEIWRASHPLVRDTTHAWKNTVGLRLILAWWLCFVAGICLWVFRKPIGMEREILRGGERHIAEMFVLASHAIALVEGVMLVLIIRAISQRQTERHERLSA